MTYKHPRILSALLSAAMIVSLLACPVSAAEKYYISATLNGAETYNESYPDGSNVGTVTLVKDLGVGVDVHVSVEGDSGTDTDVRPISITGTLKNGTEYKITENSDRSITLTTTESKILDDIRVTVVTTPQKFKIEATSGPLGFKNNLGSDSAPTCDTSPEQQTVNGNEAWTVAFTPKDKQQAISSLNIRSDINAQNIVSATTEHTTIGNTELKISRAGDTVTVSTQHAGGNIYITALTEQKPVQFTLSVSTSGDVSSSIKSETISAGTAKTITFTAGTGSVVDTISITDGNSTGTIGLNDSKTTVNGNTYTVQRTLDGKLTLSVPPIKANVSISATASTGKAYLSIAAGSEVACNYPSLSYLDIGEDYTVKLTPDEDIEITEIRIESATDSAVLYGNEYRFALDGRYYRVDTHYDTSRIIFFDAFPGNIKITVESKDIYHEITVRTDNHCSYDGTGSVLRVYDGDSKVVKFYPDNNHTVEELVITYDSRAIRATRNDGYIRINSVQCPIYWDVDGSVSITLYDVRSDLSILANTAATEGSGDYLVSLSADAGASFSGTGNIYVEEGGSATVRFTERYGYDIEQLIIMRGNEAYRILRGTSSATIHNGRCTFSWSSTGVSATLRGIDSDLSIYADTDYDGSLQGTTDWYGGDFLVYVEPDNGSTSTSSSRITVSKGTSKSITFTSKSGFEIVEVSVTRDGKTYSGVRGDTYITVNGQRYTLTWSSNGKVTIALSNINADMTVSTKTTQEITTSGTHTISKKPDDHSSISLNPNSTSVRSGKAVTVTIAPDEGYYLTSVEFRFGNILKLISQNTSKFTYGINSYDVQHTNDGKWSIYFKSLPADLTVISRSRPNTSGSIHASYVAGIGNNRFDPNATTTRAQAVVMLLRVLYGNDIPLSLNTAPNPYTDVPANAWYSKFIDFAYAQGLLFGLHDTGITFRPNEPISRAEYTELVCRFLGVQSNSILSNPFPDVTSQYWAAEPISYAYSQGWVSGLPDSCFHPETSISRAELVALTNRVFNRTPDKAYIQANLQFLISFADVSADNWAYYDIMEAANSHFCGYLSGIEYWSN